MRTIYVSPDFPLNRRMRKDIRRGKLQIIREGESLGNIAAARKNKEVPPTKKTFLLTYNPDDPDHRREKDNRFRNEMAAAADKGERGDNNLAWGGTPINVGGGQAVTRWNCASSVEIGDRGLLLWQGNSKADGIFGLVEAVAKAEKSKVNPRPRGYGYNALWKLDLRHCVQPEDEGGPIVPLGELEKLFPKDPWGQHWNPHQSGIKVKKPADKLVDLVLARCACELRVPVPDISDDGRLVEGGARRVTVNAYERNPKARERCIEKHGAHCHVCGFDFGEVYGDIGDGFIHVHHLTPISQIGADYRINPEEDLRPVCPNCHAMLHTNNPPLTVEELREKIRWDNCPRRKKEVMKAD